MAIQSVFGQKSDSEINFKGSLQSDMGLKFSVKVEMEADAAGIDESVATVSGGFGAFHIGNEDGVQPTMHYGAPDVGIGLNAGDVGDWLKVAAGWSTSLWSTPNDAARLIYYTPRINGVQLGLSYAPDMSDGENNTVAIDNEETETSIAANFDQAIGDAHLKASVGYSVTTTDSKAEYKVGDVVRATKSNGDTADFNIGGQVTMSGFTVGAAYSEVDAEQYNPGVLRAGETAPYFGEDQTKDVEVIALGVSYAEGPMALSASWSEQQHGAGGHDTATAVMLSAAYTLAPGVTVKSSLFTAEDETRRITTGVNAQGEDLIASAEGTAFVMGIRLDF